MTLVAEPTEWSNKFWQGVEDGLLYIQSCKKCGHKQYYPRAVCLACESADVKLIEVISKLGKIYSFTIVHRAPDNSKSVPYVVAIVELEEGPRLLTNIVNVQNLADISCDLEVKLTFFTDNSGRRLFGFAPTGSI